MLAELLTKLESMVDKRNAVTIHPLPQDPRNLIVQHGDKVCDRAVPPPLRRHKVLTLDDLTGMSETKSMCPWPEIYVAAQEIALMFDSTDRLEYATLRLTHTDRWSRIVTNPGGFALSPVEASKLIRFELNGIGADGLVPALAKVDFTRSGVDSTRAQHGKESWGKQVEASVQQADQIPEGFTAEVQVYQTRGFSHIKALVQFGIYLDVVNQKIVLRPLGDELARAAEACEQAAFEAVVHGVGVTTPVYRGSFSSR